MLEAKSYDDAPTYLILAVSFVQQITELILAGRFVVQLNGFFDIPLCCSVYVKGQLLRFDRSSRCI